LLLISSGPKLPVATRARQQKQQQPAQTDFSNCLRAILQEARDFIIQASDCLARAENTVSPPDHLSLLFATSMRDIGRQLRDGSLNRETVRLRLDLLTAEHQLAWEPRKNERRIVAAQKTQARAANCANVRYRNRTSSNRAVDSTIPAVAIFGLIAEIGAISEATQACD
jgi:hypothetical protein